MARVPESHVYKTAMGAEKAPSTLAIQGTEDYQILEFQVNFNNCINMVYFGASSLSIAALKQ